MTRVVQAGTRAQGLACRCPAQVLDGLMGRMLRASDLVRAASAASSEDGPGSLVRRASPTGGPGGPAGGIVTSRPAGGPPLRAHSPASSEEPLYSHHLLGIPLPGQRAPSAAPCPLPVCGASYACRAWALMGDIDQQPVLRTLTQHQGWYRCWSWPGH